MSSHSPQVYAIVGKDSYLIILHHLIQILLLETPPFPSYRNIPSHILLFYHLISPIDKLSNHYATSILSSHTSPFLWVPDSDLIFNFNPQKSNWFRKVHFHIKNPLPTDSFDSRLSYWPMKHHFQDYLDNNNVVLIFQHMCSCCSPFDFSLWIGDTELSTGSSSVFGFKTYDYWYYLVYASWVGIDTRNSCITITQGHQFDWNK